jgi:hypothetical protein
VKVCYLSGHIPASGAVYEHENFLEEESFTVYEVQVGGCYIVDSNRGSGELGKQGMGWESCDGVSSEHVFFVDEFVRHEIRKQLSVPMHYDM